MKRTSKKTDSWILKSGKRSKEHILDFAGVWALCGWRIPDDSRSIPLVENNRLCGSCAKADPLR